MANKETKELVSFGVELVNAVSEALKDGRVSLLDAIKLVKVLSDAGPAVQNVSGVLEEIASWSPAEKDEVIALIRTLDLPDDAKEALIEKSLEAALMLAGLVLPLIKAKA